jgi:hypothetical protein
LVGSNFFIFNSSSLYNLNNLISSSVFSFLFLINIITSGNIFLFFTSKTIITAIDRKFHNIEFLGSKPAHEIANVNENKPIVLFKKYFLDSPQLTSFFNKLDLDNPQLSIAPQDDKISAQAQKDMDDFEKFMNDPENNPYPDDDDEPDDDKMSYSGKATGKFVEPWTAKATSRPTV